MTGGIAEVVEVYSPMSIVSLVERTDEPESLMSTVKTEPVGAVVTEHLTSLNVIPCGILKVIFAVPVVSAVVSSEQAT
jgi:hypothetical protein